MARSRNDLSDILHRLCDNVYFQPPTGMKIVYPCIIYRLEGVNVKFADNGPYRFMDEYEIKYITLDPDDMIIHDIALMPLCSLGRSYVADNLYHYSYKLYF